jgi:hypothetical protein
MKEVDAELGRFNDVTSKSASAPIIRIRSQFTSSKALVDCGLLVYRDVLTGLGPSTLDEIFAFASLSHAMSRIMVRRKRMEEVRMLLDVQQLRNYIDKVDERSIFDTLASTMWSAISLPEGRDEAPRLHRGVTTGTVTEMDGLSGDSLDSGDTGILHTSLEEGALNLTERARQEYNFAMLRRLGGNDTYMPPKHIDPRDLSKFRPSGQPIPEYNQSHFYSLPLLGPPTATQPSVGFQTPPPPPGPTSSPVPGDQPVYQFQVTDEVYDCKALNLRNTMAFLVISAFASDAGDGFYRLSGSGKTAGRSRTGSAWASERSKIEKKLREEFFDPLKKGGTDDAGFLALLAVAKRFVVLGLLTTKDEVQDYLIAISKVR